MTSVPHTKYSRLLLRVTSVCMPGRPPRPPPGAWQTEHPVRVTPRTPSPQYHRFLPYGPGMVGSGEANVGFLLIGPGSADSAPLNVRADKNYLWVHGPHMARGGSSQQAAAPLLCQVRLKQLPLRLGPCTCLFLDASHLFVLWCSLMAYLSQANHGVSSYLRPTQCTRLHTP